MVDAAAHAAMPMLPPQPGDLPRHRRTGSAPRLPDQLHPVLGMAGFGSQGGALHTATAGPLHGAVAGSWGGAGSAGSNSSGVTGLASVAQQQGLHTAGHTASTLAAAPGPRQDVQAQVLQELAALHLQQPTQALQEGSNAGGAVALSAGVSPFSASAQQSEHGEQALLAQAQQYQQQQEAQQLGLFMYFVAAVVISQVSPLGAFLLGRLIVDSTCLPSAVSALVGQAQTAHALLINSLVHSHVFCAAPPHPGRLR